MVTRFEFQLRSAVTLDGTILHIFQRRDRTSFYPFGGVRLWFVETQPIISTWPRYGTQVNCVTALHTSYYYRAQYVDPPLPLHTRKCSTAPRLLT